MVQLLRESNEHTRCDKNVLVFGIPEFTAENGAKKSLDDIVSLTNTLSSLSLQLFPNVKLIRLEANTAKKPRPLKLLYRLKK